MVIKLINCIVGRLDTSLLDFLNSSLITSGYLISDLLSVSVLSFQLILSLVSAFIVLLFYEIVIILLT